MNEAASWEKVSSIINWVQNIGTRFNLPIFKDVTFMGSAIPIFNVFGLNNTFFHVSLKNDLTVEIQMNYPDGPKDIYTGYSGCDNLMRNGKKFTDADQYTEDDLPIIYKLADVILWNDEYQKNAEEYISDSNGDNVYSNISRWNHPRKWFPYFLDMIHLSNIGMENTDLILKPVVFTTPIVIHKKKYSNLDPTINFTVTTDIQKNSKGEVLIVFKFAMQCVTSNLEGSKEPLSQKYDDYQLGTVTLRLNKYMEVVYYNSFSFIDFSMENLHRWTKDENKPFFSLTSFLDVLFAYVMYQGKEKGWPCSFKKNPTPISDDDFVYLIKEHVDPIIIQKYGSKEGTHLFDFVMATKPVCMVYNITVSHCQYQPPVSNSTNPAYHCSYRFRIQGNAPNKINVASNMSQIVEFSVDINRYNLMRINFGVSSTKKDMEYSSDFLKSVTGNNMLYDFLIGIKNKKIDLVSIE